jgi:hypothetical protein
MPIAGIVQSEIEKYFLHGNICLVGLSRFVFSVYLSSISFDFCDFLLVLSR